VIIALSLLVVLEGFSIVQQAVMERQLDFKKLALRANMAVLLGGAVGVPLALAGAGVWALVAQQIVGDVTLLVFLWAMSTWRPRLRFSRRHARDLLGFSVNVFAANLAGFVNRRGDALLLGLFFGPVAVGIYRFADRVIDVVLDVTMRPIGVVTLPVLSRLQAEPERLREAVATCLRTTMVATVPVMLVLFASADEVVGVLGSEWEPAADVLRLLALVGIGKAIAFFTGPVLFAASRPRFRAVMLWILAIVSTALVVGVGAALTDSSVEDQVVGMAASRAVLFLVILVPVNLAIIAHFTGLRLRTVLPSVPAPILAGLAAIGVAQAIDVTGALDGLPPLAALAVMGTITTGVALSVLVALDRRVREQAVALLRLVSGRASFGPDSGLRPTPPTTDA
jgi:O-antigen/teichoic acid export membrane protein